MLTELYLYLHRPVIPFRPVPIEIHAKHKMLHESTVKEMIDNSDRNGQTWCFARSDQHDVIAGMAAPLVHHVLKLALQQYVHRTLYTEPISVLRRLKKLWSRWMHILRILPSNPPRHPSLVTIRPTVTQQTRTHNYRQYRNYPDVGRLRSLMLQSFRLCVRWRSPLHVRSPVRSCHRHSNYYNSTVRLIRFHSLRQSSVPEIRRQGHSRICSNKGTASRIPVPTLSARAHNWITVACRLAYVVLFADTSDDSDVILCVTLIENTYLQIIGVTVRYAQYCRWYWSVFI